MSRSMFDHESKLTLIGNIRLITFQILKFHPAGAMLILQILLILVLVLCKSNFVLNWIGSHL